MKRRKAVAIILSVLMAAQTSVMAGELVAEEEAPVQEEIAADNIGIAEELPEESMIGEQLPEAAVEEEISDGELLEEPAEDSFIPEDSFEEELVEEPVEAITENIPVEQTDAVPSEEEEIIEEVDSSDEPALIGSAASGQCGDNVFWTFNNGVLTISGSGPMWNWGQEVAEWSADQGEIKEVIIEPGVTSIGDWAFYYYNALTNVTIPDTVEYIGTGAFAYTPITSIKIPDKVTSIESTTFEFCWNLQSVTLGNNTKTIGKYAFSNCRSLTDVTIPAGVTNIDHWAFGACVSLQTITFVGDAPKFEEFDYNGRLDTYEFGKVTATVYYPENNPTWTKDTRKDYGGKLIWIPMRSNGKPCFSDVTDNADFFYEPIYWAVDNGITTGYSDNTFRPRDLCHRAAVVTFLWRMAGKPDEGISTAFSDMTGNEDFDRAITWAANHGITTGYKDGTFRPYAKCHRAAIITFLWRFANSPEPHSAAGFSDMTNNNDFDKAIAWAAENNIVTGYDDGTFRPYNSCLRLAVVTFLYRYAHL